MFIFVWSHRGLGVIFDSAEKPSYYFLLLSSFLELKALTGQSQFVAVIDFPLHYLSWFDINGRSQRKGYVDILPVIRLAVWY